MAKKYDFSWDAEKAKEKKIPFNQELYEKKLEQWKQLDWHKYLNANLILPFKAKRVTPWEELDLIEELEEFGGTEYGYEDELIPDDEDTDQIYSRKSNFDTESFAEEDLQEGFHEYDPLEQSDELEDDIIKDELDEFEDYLPDDEDFHGSIDDYENYLEAKSKNPKGIKSEYLEKNDADIFDYGKEMDVVEIIKNSLNQSILAKVKIKNKSNYIPLFEIEPLKETDPNYWILREYQKAVNYYGSDLDEIQTKGSLDEVDIQFPPLSQRAANFNEKILVINTIELLDNKDSIVEGLMKFVYIPEQMNVIELAQTLAIAYDIEFDNEFIYSDNIDEWQNSDKKFESDQDNIQSVKLADVFAKKSTKWLMILGFERDHKFIARLENTEKPAKKQKYPLIRDEEE